MSLPISDPGERSAVFHPDPDPAGTSVRGNGVIVFAQVSKTAIQLGAIMLLARLVAPEAFGLVAMVVAVLVFLEFFRDLVFSGVTIRRVAITHAEVSTLFWLGAGASLLAFVAIGLLAPLLSSIYGREELTGIAFWIGASVLIGGLATQHLALLRRAQRFAALAVAEICAAVVGIIVAVVVAMMDGGVWALVAQRLAWTSAQALVAWTQCRWRPGMPTLGEDPRRLLRPGHGSMLSSAAELVARTLDQALIGWMWGAVALGFYERANRLLLVPIQRMNTPLMSVAGARLARMRHRPQRYRKAYLRIFENVCMVSMPVAALLAAAPDWAVAVLLGPQWGEAVEIVLWLAIVALYQPAANAAGWLQALQERTERFARCVMMAAAVRLAALAAGLPFGAAGVALAFAVSGFLVHVPLVFWAAGRHGPVSARDLYVATVPSVIAAGAVFGAVWGVRQMPGLMPQDPLLALFAALCIGLAATLLCFLAFRRGRRVLRQLRSVRLTGLSAEAQS